MAALGWLGWPCEFGAAAAEFAKVRGWDRRRRHRRRVRQRHREQHPLKEPFLTGAPRSAGSRSSAPPRRRLLPVEPGRREASFTADMYPRLVYRGVPRRDRNGDRHLTQRLGRFRTADRAEYEHGRRDFPHDSKVTSAAPGGVVQPGRARPRRAASGEPGRLPGFAPRRVSCGSSRRASPTARRPTSPTTRASASTGCAIRPTPRPAPAGTPGPPAHCGRPAVGPVVRRPVRPVGRQRLPARRGAGRDRHHRAIGAHRADGDGEHRTVGLAGVDRVGDNVGVSGYDVYRGGRR